MATATTNTEEAREIDRETGQTETEQTNEASLEDSQIGSDPQGDRRIQFLREASENVLTHEDRPSTISNLSNATSSAGIEFGNLVMNEVAHGAEMRRKALKGFVSGALGLLKKSGSLLLAPVDLAIGAVADLSERWSSPENRVRDAKLLIGAGVAGVALTGVIAFPAVGAATVAAGAGLFGIGIGLKRLYDKTIEAGAKALKIIDLGLSAYEATQIDTNRDAGRQAVNKRISNLKSDEIKVAAYESAQSSSDIIHERTKERFSDINSLVPGERKALVEMGAVAVQAENNIALGYEAIDNVVDTALNGKLREKGKQINDKMKEAGLTDNSNYISDTLVNAYNRSLTIANRQILEKIMDSNGIDGLEIAEQYKLATEKAKEAAIIMAKEVLDILNKSKSLKEVVARLLKLNEYTKEYNEQFATSAASNKYELGDILDSIINTSEETFDHDEIIRQYTPEAKETSEAKEG